MRLLTLLLLSPMGLVAAQNVPNNGMQQQVIPNGNMNQPMNNQQFQQPMNNQQFQQPVNNQQFQQPNMQMQQQFAPRGGANVQGNQVDNSHNGRSKSGALLISETKECAADVRRICPENMWGSNFNVLTCLSQRKDDTDISEECHTYIWDYKRQMSTDPRFVSMLRDACKDELQSIKEKGSCGSSQDTDNNLVSCLMLHKNDLRPHKDNRCVHMVDRISIIVFQDYRLIGTFYEKCKDDVQKTKCGSIDLDQNPSHTQGYTIECLREHYKEVSADCKSEIRTVAELQAEDFNLDRAVYFACREDRKLLCKDVAAGEGRVYQCLMDNKEDNVMSPECKNVLMTREKLIVEDPKVSFPLREYCMEDLERFKGECDFDDMTQEHSKMASMLLCLEFKQRNGKPLTSKCVNAMRGARRMLMSDYELNPAIVKHCGSVITDHCGQMEKGGKTLHCLMKLAKNPTDDFNLEEKEPKCFKSIEFLIRSVNPIEDISTDAVLVQACKQVIDINCKKPNGRYEEDITGCLFEKIEDATMTDDCAEVLLEISYFTARDWALDRKLFRACSADAKSKCHVTKWTNRETEHGEIFACLYRHINHENEQLKLSDQCTSEVIRVMKNRAVAVGLNPFVEFNCRQDLAMYCSDPEIANKHKELQCLQDIYSVGSHSQGQVSKKLSEGCSKALKNYTKVETEDVEINRKMYSSCKPMIEKYCKSEQKGASDQGALFECMVEHKNERDVSEICVAGIEHMQLIQLKDFDFDKKFKKACREDVSYVCESAKTKDEVVTCLSKSIRDDKIQKRPVRVSEKCQKELQRPLRERYEDIKMDRETYLTCKDDVASYCGDIKSGEGRVLECLKDHKEELTSDCRKKIFHRQLEELEEPDHVQEKDYVLNKVCKDMIAKHCEDEENVLKCLWKHRTSEDFDDRCLKIVHKRLVAKGEDVRLNADMFKACQTDIKTHCREALDEAKAKAEGEHSVEEYQGVVINCLRVKYADNKLSEKCGVQVRQFIRISAHEWKMDFKLKMACTRVVADVCSSKPPNKVEECLKEMFASGDITDNNDPKGRCREEIKRVLDEGAVDIQADPILQKTCSLDIEHHCSGVAAGNKRQITCLTEKLASGAKLTSDCKSMLNERMQMWSLAGPRIHKLDSINDLMATVNESANKNYFLTIFGLLIACIFFGGLLFGRVTKRVAREMKAR